MGLTEALCAEWYDAIPYGLQVVGAVEVDRPISIEQLSIATDHALRRHPILSSRIERVNDDWWFTPSPRPRAVVRRAPSGSSWRDRFAAALATPLDLSDSPWFVELVVDPTDAPERTVIIAVGCHAMFDGVALTQFLRELIEGSDDPTPLSVQLPMEDHLPLATTSLAPSTLNLDDQWPVQQRASASHRAFGFLDRRIEAVTVDALLARARAERTTIASALATTSCRARHALTGHGNVVGFNVPFDARRRVTPPLPHDTIGAYFGRAHLYGDGRASDSDPWEEARRLDAALRAEIAGASQPSAWDSNSIRTQVAELCRDDRSTFDLDVLLTDLGRVDLGPAARGYWFTTVQTTGLEAFVVSASSADGALDLGIGWPRPLVSDDTAQTFADVLVTQLHELITI